MLFSRESVATFVNQSFEPVWESVRPVPIIHIDFGNGTVLTRTLHGNILTSVCTPDGLVLDALPGIYAETTYLDRLNQLRLFGRYTQLLAPETRTARVAEYHRTQAAALAKKEKPELFVERKRVAPITKRIIETPMEVVLKPPAPPPAAVAAQQPAGPAAEATVPAEVGEDVTRWKALEEDTRLNESTRRRQIHELLVDAGLVRPEKVTRPIYKDVLHADLDDPYLGLGKVLFDNYPFAQEDRGS